MTQVIHGKNIRVNKVILLVQVSFALAGCFDLEKASLEIIDSCGASLFEGLSEECAKCARQTCCNETAACAAERECSEALRSRAECRDPYCFKNDGLGYESGRQRNPSAVRDAVDTCMVMCKRACGIGITFDCNLNHVIPTGDGTATLEIAPFNSLTKKILTDVRVEAWTLDDDPMLIAQGKTESEEDTIVLSLPERFLGELRFERSGHITVRHIFSRPFVGTEKWWLPIITDEDVAMAEAILATDFDTTTRGVLLVTGFDCTSTNAPELTIVTESDESIDEKTTKAYFRGYSLDPNAETTDELGTVVVWNLLPGTVRIAVKQQSTGLGIGVQFATIAAGEVTWISVFPLSQFP